MLNEKEIRESVDRRLSALQASPVRRAAIRTAIDAERKEQPYMKRRMSVMWVCVLVLVLLTATVAVGERLNLFSFFGEKDERYAQVAQQAQLQNTQGVQVEWNAWEPVKAKVDSAYFDGLTLNLALQVENGMHAETWVADESHLSQMRKVQLMPVAIEAGHPDSDIFRAFNEALEKGTPYGYRAYTVYTSDHAIAKDGTDIPPHSYTDRYTPDGALCEMREFETPLPQNLRVLDELSLSIQLYRAEEWVYFDGENCYRYDNRSECGNLEAVVPKTEHSLVLMQAEGMLSGMPCNVQAEISPMAAVVTLSADPELYENVEKYPEDMAENDCWLELVLVDEEGTLFRAQQNCVPDASGCAEVTLLGTGKLPRELTLYLYPAWEGMETVEFASLEGILLTP